MANLSKNSCKRAPKSERKITPLHRRGFPFSFAAAKVRRLFRTAKRFGNFFSQDNKKSVFYTTDFTNYTNLPTRKDTEQGGEDAGLGWNIRKRDWISTTDCTDGTHPRPPLSGERGVECGGGVRGFLRTYARVHIIIYMRRRGGESACGTVRGDEMRGEAGW